MYMILLQLQLQVSITIVHENPCSFSFTSCTSFEISFCFYIFALSFHGLKRIFDDYAYLVMMACIIILVFTMTNPPSVGLNVLIVTIPVFS